MKCVGDPIVVPSNSPSAGWAWSVGAEVSPCVAAGGGTWSALTSPGSAVGGSTGTSMFISLCWYQNNTQERKKNQ